MEEWRRVGVEEEEGEEEDEEGRGGGEKGERVQLTG